MTGGSKVSHPAVLRRRRRLRAPGGGVAGRGWVTARAGAALIALLLPGCGAVAAEGWQRVPGAVDPSLSSIQMIGFPPEVRAGVPFEVVVTTLGSSSCTRADGAEVHVAGSTVRITPYDRVAPPDTPCTRDLRGFPRSVSVAVSNPGTATLIVEGRRTGGRPEDYEATLTVAP